MKLWGEDPIPLPLTTARYASLAFKEPIEAVVGWGTHDNKLDGSIVINGCGAVDPIGRVQVRILLQQKSGRRRSP